MGRPGFLVLMLLLIAGFIVPTMSSPVSATTCGTISIALAEAEDEDEDYEDYREEAAGDIYSHSEYEGEEDVDQQEEQAPSIEEEETLDFDVYEDDPEY